MHRPPSVALFGRAKCGFDPGGIGDSPGQIRTAVARSLLGVFGRSRASNHWPATAWRSRLAARPRGCERDSTERAYIDFSYWAASLSRRNTQSFSNTARNGAARGPFSDPSRSRYTSGKNRPVSTGRPPFFVRETIDSLIDSSFQGSAEAFVASRRSAFRSSGSSRAFTSVVRDSSSFTRFSVAYLSAQTRDCARRLALRARSKSFSGRVNIPVSRMRLRHHSSRLDSGLICDKNAAWRYDSANGFSFGEDARYASSYDRAWSSSSPWRFSEKNAASARSNPSWYESTRYRSRTTRRTIGLKA